jgi:hypothetical protein
VRREGAERYLFLTLVAFASTVIVTRWYLQLTGFPRIGGGDLHIAHALWGGAALFAAALLPILLAGRSVYRASAVLAGIGIGLFIDEVGKFITAQNDYFYPAAAPIIYATFLLAVLVWIRARRERVDDHRTQLLTALELMEESIEGDLQRSERDLLHSRLAAVASGAEAPEQRRLAAELVGFVEARELALAPDRRHPLDAIDDWLDERADRWIGLRGIRVGVVAALFITGLGQALALVGIGLGLRVDPSVPVEPIVGLRLLHLVVEGLAGALLVAGAFLITAIGHQRLGWTLAYFGLLVALTLADLIAFYIRQFDSIIVALGHLALLSAVVAFRRGLRAEPQARRQEGAAGEGAMRTDWRE